MLPSGRRSKAKKTRLTVRSVPTPVRLCIDFQGRCSFQPEITLDLIREIEEGLQVIRAQAVLSNAAEPESIMEVYRNGIRFLQARIAKHGG